MRNLHLDIFIELNRNKVKFIFLFTSVVFLGLLALVLLIAYYNGSFPGRSLLINILLSTGLGFPTFISMILYLKWLRKHQAKMYIFSTAPFDKLDSIGFKRAYSNLETKWNLTEEIKAGRINNFSLTCDLSERKSRVLEFEAQSAWKQLDKKEFQRISKKFEKQNVEIRIGAFIKNISIKNTQKDIHDLKQELQQFTELLKSEGFRSP
jgi:uncharacterized membrane protein (DUF485 family)